ncbi:hypothetical protein Hypma_015981 [Hypsizygus marmoreus]|uniref:Uncharacterized protein n=1 Tax=Hypsizygus marmoreus TaxID=39966 RepID=A0A369KAD3_HYPMA|nr:hypothetical protein Hypma_015981 [Hypsizygus marmoreus]
MGRNEIQWWPTGGNELESIKLLVQQFQSLVAIVQQLKEYTRRSNDGQTQRDSVSGQWTSHAVRRRGEGVRMENGVGITESAALPMGKGKVTEGCPEPRGH